MTSIPQTIAKDQKPTVLFVAENPEENFGIRDLLLAENYEVYCRDSKIRAFQLMTVYQIDLVICDQSLVDSDPITFVRELRTDSSFINVPVLVIADDDEGGSVCIQSFEAGVDDFVQTPFVLGVLRARCKRLVHRFMHGKDQDKSSLEVEATARELPGIVQYLEAEVKTGKLTVKCSKGTVIVSIKDGVFIEATGPLCEGTEALTEALCWEKTQVSFLDCDITIPEGKDTIKLTSLVSQVVDKDTQAKIDIVKQRLIDQYGYDDQSATDVLNFVASIFARGDVKEPK